MDRRAAWLALTIVGLAFAAAPRAAGPGPTYVEGSVSGLTDWTPEASPYILLNNVTVPAEATLRVHAGVEVRANRFTRIDVLGTLIVEGNADFPVRFTANATPGDAGYWQGIRAENAVEVSITGAVVEMAEAALTVFGGSARVVDSRLTGNFHGLRIQDGAATVVGSALSENGMSGVYARGASVAIKDRSLLAANRVGLDLGASEVLVENSTFVGPTFADVSLDAGSVARLRLTGHEGPVKFWDEASRLDIEGVLNVTVSDTHGAFLAGAAVVVENNPNGTNETASTFATTNGEGHVPGLVLTARSANLTDGVRDFNPFHVSAEARGAQGETDVFVLGFADVTVTLPADLTAPQPPTLGILPVYEDEPIAFDASGATDNDPDLATTGAFTWSFPEIGVTLFGIQATYTFATPGLYEGMLTVTDAAGNDAAESFAVQVLDRTPPVIASLEVPASGAVGQTLAFDAAATDNDPAFGTDATYAWRFSLADDTQDFVGSHVELAFDRPGTWTVALTVSDAAGNAVSEERTVTVVAPPTPPPPSPWPWVGGGLALLAAAVGLATERGKVGLFTLLIPLYTRIKDEEVLDQFTRGQIYGYIRVHPGDTYTDIKRNLDLNNGTLTYHVDVLEKQGLIRSVVRGPRKMFYPVDVRPPEDGGGLAEIQRRLLKGLDEAPGIAVADLAASLGVSRQLALYHLRILAKRGIVRLERRGIKLCGSLPGRQKTA